MLRSAVFRPLPEFDFFRPRAACDVSAARGCSRGAAGVAAPFGSVKKEPSVDWIRSYDAIHGEWPIGALNFWTTGFMEPKKYVSNFFFREFELFSAMVSRNGPETGMHFH